MMVVMCKLVDWIEWSMLMFCLPSWALLSLLVSSNWDCISCTTCTALLHQLRTVISHFNTTQNNATRNPYKIGTTGNFLEIINEVVSETFNWKLKTIRRLIARSIVDILYCIVCIVYSHALSISKLKHFWSFPHSSTDPRYRWAAWRLILKWNQCLCCFFPDLSFRWWGSHF